MRLALAELDNGLVLEKGHYWTFHCELADKFPDLESVSRMAADYQIRNAAAAVLSHNPLRASGFLWITKPN